MHISIWKKAKLAHFYLKQKESCTFLFEPKRNHHISFYFAKTEHDKSCTFLLHRNRNRHISFYFAKTKPKSCSEFATILFSFWRQLRKKNFTLSSVCEKKRRKTEHSEDKVKPQSDTTVVVANDGGKTFVTCFLTA